MDNETTERTPMPAVFSSILSSAPVFEMNMGNSKNVLKAYLEAQRNSGKVLRNKKNAQFGAGSKYADLTSVLEAVDVALQDAGLVLMQPFQYELIDGKHVLMLYTCIAHAESGEAIITAMPLPNLPDPQKLGSAITYFRRYSIMNMMGLAPEDDDGNLAAGHKPAEPKSVATRNAALGPHKANLKEVMRAKGVTNKAEGDRLLTTIGVKKTFNDITEDEAPAIITKLEQVGAL